MSVRVTCGTVGSGTDEDPFRPYVADLWPSWSAVDRRGDGLPWLVTLARPADMGQGEYNQAMADILDNPLVDPA